MREGPSLRGTTPQDVVSLLTQVPLTRADHER